MKVGNRFACAMEGFFLERSSALVSRDGVHLGAVMNLLRYRDGSEDVCDT